MKKPYLCLLIIDGLGKGENNISNPFRLAKKNIFEELKKKYPFCYLQASGFSVGLPVTEPGNCEQGHLTLGTGIINFTPKVRIDLAIEKGEIKNNQIIKKIIEFYFNYNSRIHFLLTLNQSPVEADLNHLFAFLEDFKAYQLKEIFFHFFLDSTYSPPKSSLNLIPNFLKELKERKLPGKIATLIGRFYALDASQNYYLRTQRAFLALVQGIGTKINNLEEFLQEKTKDPNFKEDMLEPVILEEKGIIRDNDIVIFFNFENQKIKQLARAFLDPNFQEFPRPSKENLLILTLVDYFEDLPQLAIFPQEKIRSNLSRIISEIGLRQFKITDETRKKHITYYLNGLIDEEHLNEIIKILPAIDSEENAFTITDEIFNYLKLIIRDKSFHFILANLSLFDFFGHLGDFNKAVKAIDYLSEKLSEFIELIKKENWLLIITSDHGNIEKMIDLSKGTKDTSHNFSPVPFYLISKEWEKEIPRREEILGDLTFVLPTILDLYGVLDKYQNFFQGKSLLPWLI
ncbi:2,3-bisphosphoglycerate-independent phosphoglycerate mutase [bacterium HR35]|nr:2,3-bisphosphoglycerate-independent phosphoglycerate mutase [bacterium HR35]